MLYTGGQLLRGTERLLLIFAPAAYQGTLRDVPAKMYRPIKMDYRFDPTHIIFRASLSRSSRDEARKTINGNSSRMTTKEARLMRFYRSAVRSEIFNGICVKRDARTSEN